MRTHAKLQGILSIISLFTAYLKLTCQSIFFNLEKIEYRAVIRFFVLKGLKVKEIYEHLLKVYKVTTNLNVTRLEDDSREGRPKPQPHQKSLSKFIILLANMKKLFGNLVPHTVTIE